MTDLKALSDAATQGVLWLYGEPEVGLDYEPFFGAPLEGNMHPLQPMTREDQAFTIALWNAYRAGTIGDTAAADKAGYERGLREAADEVQAWFPVNTMDEPRYAAGRALKAAILAKLETVDEW